jgi:hypothetical protein
MTPVIQTFEKELKADGLNALKPLERADEEEGVAYPDEAKQVVVNRSGGILSASTILKSDFFLNLQKMTLPEFVFFFINLHIPFADLLLHRRIDGSPNFRRLPLTLRLISSVPSSPSSSSTEFIPEGVPDGKMVCGWFVSFIFRHLDLFDHHIHE